MGHTERIIAELATLDEAQQASLWAFLEQLKAQQLSSTGSSTEATAQREARAVLSAALAPYRIPLAGHRFDREEANAR